MKPILSVLFIALSCGAMAQEFSIDNYLVRWHYLVVGNTEIRIMKNEERIYVNVYKSNGIVSAAAGLPADDAVAVGEVLARTQEFFDAQAGATENVAENLTAGNFRVTFRTSPFNGFTVVIQEDDRFSTNAVTLTREEAIGIQPGLLKARELVAYLESQVTF